MVFLVPFDGSPVSEAALARAVEYGTALGEEVLAVAIIPTGAAHVERRKWIQPDEDFAAETASAELRRKIEEATDDAERTFAESGAQSPEDGLTQRVRQVAADVDTSVLFVGATATAGNDRLQTPFGDIANSADYDIHVVRAK
jgi:nucleotide-binding universal stress UspA family protein